MGGHAHHRARAVVGQYVVGDPDRHAFARERIDRVSAREDAGLGHQLRALEFRFGAQFGRERLDLRAPVGQRGQNHVDCRMLRRQRQERHAVDRIDARRVDVDLRRQVLDVERERDAFALADPVALHGLDARRPSVEPLDSREQPVRVLGDLQKPLRKLAPLDHAAAAPADAFDDLFVGQHRLIDGAPVHRRLALICQAPLVHPQEEPLIPAVVLRIAGRKLARPVVAGSHEPDLAFHIRDVRAGPGFGRDAALDRGIFGRQPKGVPAHRMHDVVAAHAHHPRHRVAQRIVLGVADMQIARRVGQHFEHVVLGPRVAVVDAVDALAFPAVLPDAFDGAEIVGNGTLFEHPVCYRARTAETLPRRFSSARDGTA